MSDIDELRSSVATIMSRSIVDGHFSCTEEECHQKDGSPINQLMRLITQYGDKRELEGRIDGND